MQDLAPLSLELELAPEDVALLLRQKELLVPGSRRRLPTGRASKCNLIWHDTPDGALAAEGRSLAQSHTAAASVWRLERLVPEGGSIAPPGAMPALISQTGSPPEDVPTPLLPIAAFDGQLRTLLPEDGLVGVVLLQGQLRAVAATRMICRLRLTGSGAAALALEWAGRLRLSAPRDTLAAQAIALSGRDVPPRKLGAPSLLASQDVDTGFATVVAHLAGVMAHYAPAADGAHGMEPVHQMRVALRRLRSAMQLFRRAVACPAMDDATQRLKALGQVLGPPRDWDVFTSGTGRAVAEAIPDDKAVTALLAAAEKRRLAGYTALARYLASPAWRLLGVTLAALALQRPWRHFTPEEPDQAERHALSQRADLPDFAARALSRRLQAVLTPGEDLSSLPVEALHELRLHGKRLRYAAEFFAPLFPGRETRRFLRRMTDLQERLGHLNDGAVAAALMAELPGRGATQLYAIGVVRGFIAASTQASRRRIGRSWSRFRKQYPFWT